MTVLAFPLNRCRPPGYGPSHDTTVVSFPTGLPAPDVPTWPAAATRAEIFELVSKVADATGQDTRDVNLALLRRGFPRRAHCTPTDLANIRDILTAELLSARQPQATA
ncbi:MAG: hypothetical protein ACRDT0_14130 [Pseudonocardiaceae bacterium]